MTTITRSTVRRTTAGLVLGAMALLVSGCGLSLQSMPKPGTRASNTYTLYATFSDVLNLPSDAQVRDGSQIVGSVGSMTEKDYLADVELRIDDSYHVPRGSTAEIRFDNPLGDQYVELTKPKVDTQGYLPPGSRLALTATSAAPTVEDTLGGLATVLNGGGIGNIQEIAHELNEMFHGNQAQIRDLLEKLNTAATDLAGGIGSVDAALDAVNALATQLNADDTTLPEGIKALSEAIGVLAGQNTQFNQLLAGLSDFGKAGNKVIAVSGKQTVKALKKLLPVVNQIVASDAEITPALHNLQTLEAQIPKVTRGGYAHVSIRLPVSVSSAPSTLDSSAKAAALLRAPVTSLMTGMGPLTTADPGPSTHRPSTRSAR